MLVIKIEIWPYGQKEKAEVLGTVHIINDGTGTSFDGNYDVAAYEGYVEKPYSKKNLVGKGKIKAYSRRNGFFQLAAKTFFLLFR